MGQRKRGTRHPALCFSKAVVRPFVRSSQMLAASVTDSMQTYKALTHSLAEGERGTAD